ncbi:MAG: CapA family protein [Calditrichaeota bacterium]|nr:CapA family protein [Calditrichota bacterium]
MKRCILATLCVLTFFVSCSDPSPELNLAFAGDVILDRGVDDQMRLHGDTLLVNALQQFQGHDYLLINYEGTFSGSPHSQNDRYNFKTEENRAALLRAGGVSHASLANNHSFDFGPEGFQNTLQALQQHGVTPLGTDCFPVLLTNRHYRCAVLAASLTAHNETLCIAAADSLLKRVGDFKTEHPAVPLIVYIHWGLELQPRPADWQRRLAAELAATGVDAIIGHHPHVVQSIEFIGDVPVFYSLGNFVADAYLPSTDEAIIANLSISDKLETIRLAPITLIRYFPRMPERRRQLHIIQDFLQHSPEVALLESKAGWQVKPAEAVDFREAADLWLFSGRAFVAAVKKLATGPHLLTLLLPDGKSNTVSIHGSLSELKVADIDHDGKEDILLGIRKKVVFDTTRRKRLNVFSFRDNNLQPLWLGTKLIYNLVSFDTYSAEGLHYLTTVEEDSLGNRYAAVYEWDHFGFALNRLRRIHQDETTGY